MLLGIHQERGQVTPQHVLQTLHQTATESQKSICIQRLWIRRAEYDAELRRTRRPRRKTRIPVSAVHQVGQIQATLPRQRAQVAVVREEVEQFGGVGHPEGQSAGDGPLALRGKSRSRVRMNRSTLINLPWFSGPLPG